MAYRQNNNFICRFRDDRQNKRKKRQFLLFFLTCSWTIHPKVIVLSIIINLQFLQLTLFNIYSQLLSRARKWFYELELNLYCRSICGERKSSLNFCFENFNAFEHEFLEVLTILNSLALKFLILKI